MISKDEVIEMASKAGGETRYFSIDRVEGFSFFTMPEFERFADACYKRGIEDSAKVCDGTCNVNNCLNDEDAYYGRGMAKAVRKLGETE